MTTNLITPENVDNAAELLKLGKVVAFPTETVYGLGAIANNEEAIKRVYAIKGRPSDNPLIVHVASPIIDDYIVDKTSYVDDLIKKFWPGPLTLICRINPNVFATSLHQNRDTIALRMPNSELTLELIEKVGFPIVGPSANMSGKPSPTRAAHVLDDFFGKIEGVLYGENAPIGIESTVIDVTNVEGLVILRPGSITLEDLAGFPILTNQNEENNHQDVPLAPGMKYKHYAPRQPIYLIDSQSPDLWDKACLYFQKEKLKVGILADENLVDCYDRFAYKTYSLGGIEDTVSASKYLYDGLRFFDKSDVDIILAQSYEKLGIGVALMNRLEKAADGVYFEGKLDE